MIARGEAGTTPTPRCPGSLDRTLTPPTPMLLPRHTSPTSIRARFSRRAVTFATLGGLALGSLVTACSESPLAPGGAPAEAPSRGLVTSTTSALLTAVVGLQWSSPVSQATATRVIGPDGGSLSIPNGITVTVPKGAVSTNVTFSVTRLPGTIVAYDFQPHGTTFAVPLTIEQPTLGTNLTKLPAATSVQGAYFPLASSLDQLLGTALVSEFQPTFVSADKAWIKFTVQHFSGYMVSTGRK